MIRVPSLPLALLAGLQLHVLGPLVGPLTDVIAARYGTGRIEASTPLMSPADPFTALIGRRAQAGA